MDQQRLIARIDDLRKLPAETEWVEFKDGNTDPEHIAKRVSGLSNGARLTDEQCGYLIWGINDETHDVVGTKFKGAAHKVKGQQTMAFWLSKQLDPCPSLDFYEVTHPQGRLVLLAISPAVRTPTRFNGIAYIRVDSSTTALSEHPALEEKLWGKLKTYAWEKDAALEFVSGDEVLSLLDTDSFFRLTNTPRPSDQAAVLAKLRDDGLIALDAGGRWNVLNLGAILFARELAAFPSLAAKAIRVVEYSGTSRIRAKKEHPVLTGYAVALDPLVDQLMAITSAEDIDGALKLRTSPFPKVAFRELLANAVIHQDMTMRGARPTVELFTDRFEITNPGEPIVDVKRILDSPPKSRNEQLARLMRRMDLCEERGSGIDRVVEALEQAHLPPLTHTILAGQTRAAVLTPRPFAELTPSEKTRACFQHAALQFENNRRATNASLRTRFAVPKTNAAAISKVIAAAKKAKLVKPADPAAPNAGVIPWYG